MADNTSQATFQEVLEVTADKSVFEASLAQIEDAYNEFIARIGSNGADIINVGSFAAIQDTLKNILESVDESVAKVSLLFEAMSENSLAAVKSVQEAEQASTDQELSNIEAVTSKKLASLEEIAQAKIAKGASQNFGKDLATEQEGQATLQTEAVAKLEQMYAALFDQIDAGQGRQRALAEDIAIEQEGQVTAQAEGVRKTELMYAAMFDQIAAGQERLAQLARDINSEQQGLNDQARIAQERELVAVQEQYAAALERTTSLQERLNVQSLSSREQIDYFSQRLQQIREQIAAIESAGNITVGAAAGPALPEGAATAQREYNVLLNEQLGLEKQLASATAAYAAEQNKAAASSVTFFEKMLGGLGDSLLRLAAFQLEWQLILGVINAVTSVIEAPFKAIANGVEYLQKMEISAAELAVALNANVKFSGNLVENLNLSRDAANQLVLLLQDRALASGLPVDQLTNTFKALVNTDAVKGVQNMRDMVTLAQDFAVTMGQSGLGTRDVQQQLRDMASLFDGTLNGAAARFLINVGLTKAQWEGIRDAGLAHGDLVSRLAPLLAPYLDASQKVALTQTVLKEQFGILVDRMEAAAASGAFALFGDGLLKVVTYLKDNLGSITSGLTTISSAIKDAAVQMASLAESTADVKSGFQNFGFGVLAIANSASLMAANFRLAFAEFNAGTNGSTDNVAKLVAATENLANVKLQATVDQVNFIASMLNTSATGKGVLDAPVDPKKNNIDPKGTASGQKLDSKEIGAEIDAIKAKYAELQESVRASLSAQDINHAEALAIVKKGSDDEIASLAKVEIAYTNAAIAKNKAIVSDPNSSSAEKSKASLALQTQLETQNERVLQAARASQKTVATFQDQANSESFKVDEVGYDAKIKLQQEYNKAAIALVKAQYAEGYLTELEAFDKERAITQQSQELELNAANQKLSLFARGSVGYAEQLAKIQELGKASVDSDTTTTARRLVIQQEELTATIQFYQKLSELQIQSAQEGQKAAELLSGYSGYTKAQEDLLNAEATELYALRQITEARLAEAQAKNADSIETRQLTVEVEQLAIKQQAQFNAKLQQIQRGSGTGAFSNLAVTQATQQQLGVLQGQQASAQANLANFQQQNAGEIDGGVNPQILATLDSLTKNANDASTALSLFTKNLSQAVSDAGSKLIDDIGGKGLTAKFQAAQNIQDPTANAVAQMGVAAQGIGTALNGIMTDLQTYAKGFKQGGVAGGVGAVISANSGIFSDASKLAQNQILSNAANGVDSSALLQAVPVIGSVIAAIGPLLSFIGQVFTAAAAATAAKVKDAFQDTVNAFNSGDASLVNTITAIEQERNEAISQLSGEKGGQSQLNTLLPQLDNEIASLQAQATKTMTDFDTATNSLSLQSTTLSTILNQWQAINTQVSAYLNAGGNATEAAKNLSLNLEQIQLDAQTQLNQGNEQAISDAENLNSLLLQRNNLEQQYNQQVFALENQDSIERETSSYISQAQQLALDQQNNANQLTDLNSQIDLATQKVALESQVFNIAQDTYTLEQQGNALAITALQTQIQQWNDLKTIIGSISQGANGVFSGTGIFGTTTSTVNNQIDITVNILTNPVDSSNASSTGTQIADAISAELQRQAQISLV